MATKRLTMTMTMEILRHKWALGRSHREVAQSLDVSAGMVGATLARANKAELREWNDVVDIDDSVLEERLYPGTIETSRRVQTARTSTPSEAGRATWADVGRVGAAEVALSHATQTTVWMSSTRSA